MNRLNAYPIFRLLGAILAAFAASLAIIIPTLRPPPDEMQLLLLYMGGSGVVTVGGVYLLHKARWLRRLNTLRWALLAIILLTVALVFANVLFTLQLMYISEHDMMLTAGLLVFAGIIAVISAMVVASSIIERIRHLDTATRHLAGGDLKTRVDAEGNDEIAQLAAMFNNMAEALEAADAQKHLLEKSRRDLVAWASHDLRTPLASIRAMNEAMLDGVVTDPETVRRYRQQTHLELQNLSQLIDDLFEMAQLDAGPVQLNRKPSVLGDLMTTVLVGISARAAEGDITVVHEAAADLPLLHIAPDRIQRVLNNLLDNALHHTPPGGRVTLSARYSPGWVSVQVHNTGSVIPPDDLPHVFERFYRVERSRARSSSGHRGSGLGLAIARGFVEAHGGSISVTSSPEHGTTFTFSLPV